MRRRGGGAGAQDEEVSGTVDRLGVFRRTFHAGFFGRDNFARNGYRVASAIGALPARAVASLTNSSYDGVIAHAAVASSEVAAGVTGFAVAAFVAPVALCAKATWVAGTRHVENEDGLRILRVRLKEFELNMNAQATAIRDQELRGELQVHEVRAANKLLAGEVRTALEPVRTSLRNIKPESENSKKVRAALLKGQPGPLSLHAELNCLADLRAYMLNKDNNGLGVQKLVVKALISGDKNECSLSSVGLRDFRGGASSITMGMGR